MLLRLFISIAIFKPCLSERRIVMGKPVLDDKGFMVYLVKSPQSNKAYDAWLCGGTIVSEKFVLTSAACLSDLSHMYVIAGYRKYVNGLDLEKDPCTKKRKHKIVKVCVPKAYQFNSTTSQWTKFDVGVATVDPPFNFSDITYRLDCSYPPEPVLVNYFAKYQQPKTEAIVLGWGHEKSMRKPGDPYDYNSKILRVASTVIVKKDVCKNSYWSNAGMNEIIDKYMICTQGSGNLDANGQFEVVPKSTLDRCWERRFNKYRRNDKCVGSHELDYDFNWRRNGTDNGTTYNTSNADILTRRENSDNLKGICQNDHGGPLLGWAGSMRVVLGVISTTLYNKKFQCVGPYLYASTYCNGKFLQCVLSTNPNYRRSCNRIAKEEGFEFYERDIEWDPLRSKNKTQMNDEALLLAQYEEENTTAFENTSDTTDAVEDVVIV